MYHTSIFYVKCGKAFDFFQTFAAKVGQLNTSKYKRCQIPGDMHVGVAKLINVDS